MMLYFSSSDSTTITLRLTSAEVSLVITPFENQFQSPTDLHRLCHPEKP